MASRIRPTGHSLDTPDLRPQHMSHGVWMFRPPRGNLKWRFFPSPCNLDLPFLTAVSPVLRGTGETRLLLNRPFFLGTLNCLQKLLACVDRGLIPQLCSSLFPSICLFVQIKKGPPMKGLFLVRYHGELCFWAPHNQFIIERSDQDKLCKGELRDWLAMFKILFYCFDIT